jgi:hypothetical protein
MPATNIDWTDSPSTASPATSALDPEAAKAEEEKSKRQELPRLIERLLQVFLLLECRTLCCPCADGDRETHSPQQNACDCRPSAEEKPVASRCVRFSMAVATRSALLV